MNPENIVSCLSQERKSHERKQGLKGTVVTTNVSEARNSPLKVSYAAHE